MVEYRQVYEGLLKDLCEEYRSCVEILNKITEYDSLIFSLSKDCRKNAEYVVALIDYKDNLVAMVDKKSMCIEELHVKLENVSAVCPGVSYHPMYQYMIDLQKLFYYHLSTLLNKEDVNNKQVVDNLNDRKESLIIDKMISEVPENKKQVFMLVPDKL